MIYTAICGGVDPAREDISDYGKNHRLTSKLYKMLSHVISEETTVWLDGNIFQMVPESEMEKLLTDGVDLVLFKHPYRSTIREELNEVVITGKETKFRAKKFMDHFGGLADLLPLYESGILIRRNTPAVKLFNEIWLAMVFRWSLRDQLTLPIAIEKSGIKVSVIDQNLRSHPMFKYVPR